MNRIVLIGNGFDLAHGLKTKYEDFINWYWDKRVETLRYTHSKVSKDLLCSFESKNEQWHLIAYLNFGFVGMRSTSEILQDIFNNDALKVTYSSFFEKIITSIETKGWVDIENEYYQLLKQYSIHNKNADAHHLNEELKYLQDLLIEYLNEISSKEPDLINGIKEAIYEPISQDDIAVEAKSKWNEWIDYWKDKDEQAWRGKAYDFGIEDERTTRYVSIAEDYKVSPQGYKELPKLFRLPEKIMMLNFNYTPTIMLYLQQDKPAFTINNIHGQLKQPESIIFGHGDEMDEQFKQMQNLNNQEYLKNIKSINYMKSDNYKKILRYIESAPFQVYIMGHSCGTSDRTLLNTLFEHDNCVSIKPFYYSMKDGTDNYLELIQNISRSFNSMKLMRDRVVNKEYCKPLDNKQINDIDTTTQNS